MRRRLPALVVIVLTLSHVGTWAQEQSVLWKSLTEPVFDPEKTTAIDRVTLTRDRLVLTLSDGMMQFTQPASGVVHGAAFRGHGRLRIQPPNPLESQQLRLHTGQDALDMEFAEATFVFSDETFDEIAKQAKWQRETDNRLAQLYSDRQREREETGAQLTPRLLRSLSCSARAQSTLFAADLKTNQKGWIRIQFDGLDPEEVSVAQWKTWEGGMRSPDVWLSFPAGGRSPSDAYSNPLAKRDFLVRSYNIDLAVNDAAELSAVVRVTLEHMVPDNCVLLFLLDANLRVERVSEGGKPLEFFQPRDPKDRVQSYGDWLAVVLYQPGRQGQRQTMEFQYRGKRVIRRVGQGQFFCQSFGWYPATPNSFAARSDFEINFRSPKKYKLVATGNLIKEGNDGEIALSSWRSDVPLAVAGFAYGDFKVETNTAEGVTVDVYASRNPDDSLGMIARMSQGGDLPGSSSRPTAALGSLSPAAISKVMAQEVVNSINVFTNYYGPYPYRRLAVTNIPYSYGQGWPGLLYLSALSFLDSTQRNALGITDMIGITDFFRAHETSHQWWGHRVGWTSYHDQWLSEGFAQFSGNLYVQFRQNMKEYLSRLRQDKEELKGRDRRNRVYESLGPIWMGLRLASSDAPSGYATVVYSKGGYILHMLRMMLWKSQKNEDQDALFKTMMKDFAGTFENRAASTEDFKAIVEKYMTPIMDLDGNKKMDWFFRQYVYGTGIPEYRFTYQVQDAGGGSWKVSGRIVQSPVTDTWKNILPIYLVSSGRSIRLGWVKVSGQESTFQFTMPMPSKPEKITLNENEDILADIKQ